MPPIVSAKATQRNLPSGQEAIRLRAPSSATINIFRNRPNTNSCPSFSASSTTRIRARSAAVLRALSHHDHLWGSYAIDSEELKPVFTQLPFARTYRQRHTLCKTDRSCYRHSSRFNRSSLRRMVSSATPCNQLAFIEYGNDCHDIGIIDTSIQGVIGNPDIALLNTRFLL